MKKCIIMLLMIAMVLTGIMPGTEATLQAATIKGVVNTDGLNVRTDAGTNFPVLQSNGTGVKLSKGTKVTILKELVGGWYKVNFNYKSADLTGYVASMYVTLSTDKNLLAKNLGISGKMVSKQKIRKKASSKSDYVKLDSGIVKLKKNSKVKITGVYKVSKTFWYEIVFTSGSQEITGYISSDKVKLTGSKQLAAHIYNKVSVRKAAGSTKPYLKVKKKTVTLKQNKKLKVLKEKIVKNKKWFNIKFTYAGKSKKGWVPASYVMFTSGAEPVIKQTATSTSSPAPTPTSIPLVALSDAEFEANLTAQGFPESYKVNLRKLHASYPYWQFKAYNTGLDWNTAVTAESAVGKSLISNAKPTSWKSSAIGAFDYAKDSYVVFDGTSWVTASEATVAYYMDPRNSLTENQIFMFESLAYDSSYQTVDGVASILAGTLYSGASYSYIDDAGVVQSKTYQDTFIDAAVASGVSPFHLASRMKQEVVNGINTVSNSVSGVVPGYEGIYNFYNIGASDSITGGAVTNGLKYASTGTTFMRPWNNPYKSIVGGAQYIAVNYISKGQNTVYFERFNVTPGNTYKHQYMTNVAAANSEASKTYTAYKGWMATKALAFVIPVFNNMPETPCAAPVGDGNPNCYLKSLAVTDITGINNYTMTPVFTIMDGGASTYNIYVPATETAVTIKAETVNANAIVSGAGTIQLIDSTTTIPLTVTAQNGSSRTYTLVINKA